MKDKLTDENKNQCLNYGLIDICDCCGDDFPITNRHDGGNYLILTGKYLYCKKCMADPSARKRES